MDQRLSRRDMLKSVALAGGVLTLAQRSPAQRPAQEPGQEKSVSFVDAHLHCFAGIADRRFPYHPQGPYQPVEPATPEHLLECMAGAGVSHAIVVHPEPYQDDHRYLEHCLEVGGGKLKGTCLFFADRPGWRDGLKGLVERLPGQIVAARVHAYAPDRLPPFGSPELRELWKTAGELGLAMQIHFEPRYAPGFEPYIQEFSQTPVIIDHLGRPMQGTPAEHAVVVGWSRFPNTYMKIAALPPIDQFPHRDVGPVIRELVEAYGPERMITGGGFGSSATPESYRAYYDEKVRGYLAQLSAADQAQILGGTARRLFGFAAG